jgi:hypothetical protein
MTKRDERAHQHTCRGLVDLLCDYLEGDIQQNEREEIDRHMDDCPPCLGFMKTYRKTTEICKTLRPEDIPQHLKEKLEEILKSSRG